MAGGGNGGCRNVARMLHEWCSGVGHFESTERHGFATDDLTDVSLLHHVAFGSSHPAPFPRLGDVAKLHAAMPSARE